MNEAWVNFTPIQQCPDCFCEHTGNGILAQPANSISNIGHVLVGLYILFDTWKAYKRGEHYLFFRGLLGLSLLLLGIGSTFFHASHTQLGGMFDVTGMLLVVSSILFYQLKIFRAFKQWQYLLAYFAVAILHSIVIYPELFRGIFLFIASVTSATTLEVYLLWKRKITAKFRHFNTAIGIFLIATAAWIIDYSEIICDSKSIFQLHAVWHLLTALAVLALYRYLLTRTFENH